MDGVFSINDLLRKNINIRKEALYNLLLFTGPIKIKEIFNFYQDTENAKTKYKFDSCFRLLNYEKKINIRNGIVSPSLPNSLFKDTYQLSFQECLKFLEFLIQLKDENGLYVYYKSITDISRTNNYPDNIVCRIDGLLYYIQYCPSTQINEYNEFINEKDEATNTTADNIRRILVSDELLKPESVNVNGLANIVSIDKDDNIRFIL